MQYLHPIVLSEQGTPKIWWTGLDKPPHRKQPQFANTCLSSYVKIILILSLRTFRSSQSCCVWVCVSMCGYKLRYWASLGWRDCLRNSLPLVVIFRTACDRHEDAHCTAGPVRLFLFLFTLQGCAGETGIPVSRCVCQREKFIALYHETWIQLSFS